MCTQDSKLPRRVYQSLLSPVCNSITHSDILKCVRTAADLYSLQIVGVTVDGNCQDLTPFLHLEKQRVSFEPHVKHTALSPLHDPWLCFPLHSAFL